MQHYAVNDKLQQKHWIKFLIVDKAQQQPKAISLEINLSKLTDVWPHLVNNEYMRTPKFLLRSPWVILRWYVDAASR